MRHASAVQGVPFAPRAAAAASWKRTCFPSVTSNLLLTHAQAGFLLSSPFIFAALAPALALAAEEITEIRALVQLVRLAAGVALIFLLPAACLRGSAAAGAQPHLRALARAFAAFGVLCLALCGYAFVGREWLGGETTR